MRVLYYHQHFSTPQGSSGLRSYHMAKALVKKGHQVTMVCGSYQGASSGLAGSFNHGHRVGLVEGLTVVEFELPYSNYDNFWRRSWTFLRFAWRSIGVLFEQDYDLIFATTTPLTAGIPGIIGRWLLGKPFVFEVRDLWPELPKAMGVIRNPLVLSALGALEWLSYHSAHHCIGLAPGICKGIERRGLLSDRVSLVPNGCDLDLFQPGPIPRCPENIPGVKAGQVVAAFTGAHGLANRLDGILDAAAELKRRGRTDICLVFIGDGRCKPQLIVRAQRENLDNCLFLNPVSKTQLTHWLCQSIQIGLMVLDNIPAFYYGTSPNKFFDYIASGLPVVNNYPGWLAELITTHHCGLAVPPDQPVAFAEALIQLADHPDQRLQMGARARQLAEQHFSRANLAQEWIEVLEITYKRLRPTSTS